MAKKKLTKKVVREFLFILLQNRYLGIVEDILGEAWLHNYDAHYDKVDDFLSDIIYGLKGK